MTWRYWTVLLTVPSILVAGTGLFWHFIVGDTDSVLVLCLAALSGSVSVVVGLLLGNLLGEKLDKGKR